MFVSLRSLPYGSVRIYLSVTMQEVSGYSAEASLDMYIKEANITGLITGGGTVARQWNTNITVDARTNVYDPGLGSGDWTGITWM